MATQPLERKLAAILYADVAGYSRLTGQDEEGTHRALSAHLDAITAAIEHHNGKVMHFAGDAVLADFVTASDALLCAVNIQRDLEADNKNFSDGPEVQFRIGVNLGEVIVDRGEIYGDGVNIAARLESLAAPGGICISGAVYDAIGNKLPLEYAFLGEQRVKNIEQPVRTYSARLKPGTSLPEPRAAPRTRRPLHQVLTVAAVALVLIAGVIFAWQYWPARNEAATLVSGTLRLPAKPSIAVLPFDNMSGEQEQEYFVDGMTEDLITDLSKISGLFVIAQSSSFIYKGKELDARQVAQELSVRYVLEGSVRKAEGRVRINAQLIDASTGGHVWAERYDRQLVDIFNLQNEVIEQIVSALALRLTPREVKEVTHRSTNDVTAYDHFLRGQALTRTANYVQARDYYRQAIAIDPSFARAYGALSITHYVAAQYGWATDPREDNEKALTLAKKALFIDDSLPQIHFALGLAYFMNRELDKAMSASRRAIELDPGYADARGLVAWIYCHAGEPEKAIQVLEELKQISPHLNAGTLGVLGLAYLLIDDFDRAISVYEQARDSNPEQLANRLYLTAALSRSGRRVDAAWEAEEILMLNPGFSVNLWTRTQPYKDLDQVSRLRDDLRRAGLPD